MKAKGYKALLKGLTAALAVGLTVTAAVPAMAATEYTGARHQSDSSGNVFLGGNYMEIGVSKHGSFGTSAAPSGDWNYNTYGKASRGAYLGLFADGDGWNTGSTYVAGDFFTPGTPEERYIFSYKMNGTTYNINVADRRNSYDSSQWKTEPTATDISSGNTLGARVTGETAQGVVVTINYTFDVDDLNYKTDVTYVNNSGYELTDVRFVRSFDPDQDEWLYDTDEGDGYYTYNKVVSNPVSTKEGSTENCAMVVARGSTTLSGVFFLSIDNRTRASHAVDFAPTDAYLSGLWDSAPTTSVTYPTDESLACSKSSTNGYILEDDAIALTTNFGTTAIGASDTTTYYTSLNPDVLAEFNKLKKLLAATADYKNEKIKDLTPNATYEVTVPDGSAEGASEGTTYTVTADDAGTIPMAGTDDKGNDYDFMGKTVTVVEVDATTGEAVSDPQNIDVAGRPSEDTAETPDAITNTPEDIGHDDIETTEDSITVKASDTQEYSIDGGVTWISPATDPTGTTVSFTGLEPGKEYEIYTRVKATVSAPASAPVKAATVSTYSMFSDIVETNYEGVYDGVAHEVSAATAVEGAMVTYSETQNGTYTDTTFAYTDAGENTVYYCVAKEGYYNAYGTLTAKITAIDLSDESTGISATAEDQDYTGTAWTPVVVKDGDKVLVEGTDYTIEYADNEAVGIATAVITGIGNYSGTKTVNFGIHPSVTAEDLTYTGEDQTPVVSVQGIPEGTEYTIKYYLDGQDPDTATETVPTVKEVGTYNINYVISSPTEAYNNLDGAFTVTVNNPVVPEQQQVVTPEEPKIDTRANAVKMDAGLKAVQKGNKVTVSWGKVSGASKYVVYAAYCGQAKCAKVKTLKSASVTITKIGGKAINQKKIYKFYVEAYKGNKCIGRSAVMHVVGTKNKTYSNPKAVIVKKTAVTLKTGKTYAIKATVTLKNSKRKALSKMHGNTVRYLSSNLKVATVSKSGVIKGVGKGTAVVYVMAIDGTKKSVKVTVK